MTRICRLIPSAAVLGVFILYGSPGSAQPSPAYTAAGQSPSNSRAASGVLSGVVLDDRKVPVAGAMVSAVGRTVAVGTTDREGRFTLRDLPRGPYLLRAHLAGYKPSHTRNVQLSSASLTVPPVEIQRAGVAAGDGAVTQLAGLGAPAPLPAPPDASGVAEEEPGLDAESDTAWYVRHLPRSVLKEATEAARVNGEETPDQHESMFERMTETPVRLASLFAEFPTSGELNLLSAGSLDSPEDFFSKNMLGRSVTYVSLGKETPGGDWSVQGAITQGDVASWMVAGSYATAASARHAYEIGLSYGMQRDYAGNSVELPSVSDGSRNAGTLSLFDRWTIAPGVVVGYGSRYARYGYLNGTGLWSPRVAVSVTPAENLRVKAVASQEALAPGAEEFTPPAIGLWLPPERTFASLAAGRQFRPELTRQFEVSVERDVAGGFVVAVRGFRQRVEDQQVTLFGLQVPGETVADIGHYHVATAGDVEARGWGVGVTHEIAGLVRSSIAYTVATADWGTSPDAAVITLWAPSVLRQGTEEVRGLRTSVDAEIPLTSTRVHALYHLNRLLARNEVESLRPVSGVAFDVRVNQALPFMNFSSAEWEALVDIRNLFREASLGASIYDEIIIVRPPKRIVGGLTVRF